MAVAIVLGVAASSFTNKLQSSYYWFIAGTATYTNSGLKTVAQEEASLLPGYRYNTISGIPVVDGYLPNQVAGSPPVINLGEIQTVTISR